MSAKQGMMIDPADLLGRLVRFDTTNPPGNEMALIEYLCAILDDHGISYGVQRSGDNRGNLLALLPASMPNGQPPIVLLSHTDVVGAAPEQWQYPPFGGETHEGYIHGRGTVDTKQLTAMEFAAFIALADEPSRTRDIYFLATCDEEQGSVLGMQHVLAHPFVIDGKTIDAAMLFSCSDVISEGGGFPIKVGKTVFYLCETGQKSCGSVRFTIEGSDSSNPFLPNPDVIVRAMCLVKDLAAFRMVSEIPPGVRQFEQELKEAAGNSPDWEMRLSPGVKNILDAARCNTLVPTLLQGRNMLRAEVLCDVRLLPGYKPAQLTEHLDGFARKWHCTYKIERLSTGYENPAGHLARILERATLNCLGDEAEHTRLLPFISMGSSDGHFLAPLKANVYGYSPVLGWDMTFDTAVRMVHGVNERIHIDSVSFGSKVLKETLLQAVCAQAD